MHTGMTAVDDDGVEIYANAAFCKMVGWSKEELVGARPPFVYWPPEDVPRIQSALDATRRGEAPREGFELRFQRRDGTRFDVRMLVARLRDEQGGVSGWLASVYDVTEQERAERAQAFLVEAAEVLDGSLDLQLIPERIAHLAVPRMADWCSVHLVDEQGAPALASVAHCDPSKTALARAVHERWPFPPDAPVGAPLAIRTGRSLLQPRIPEDRLAMAAQSDEHLRLLRGLDPRSSIVVPLRSRGKIFGALTLVSAESKREFGRNDLRMAEQLASRAALAIDNARLLAEASRAREQAERAAERFHFLLEASNQIAAAPDDQAALQRLADCAVSQLADYCVTYRLEEGGEIQRVGIAHRDTNGLLRVKALERIAPTLDSSGAGRVIRSGEPTLVREISAARLERGAQNAEHLQLLRELDPRSCILVPLRARERTLGAVALVTTGSSSRRYDREDLLLAQKLASRTALMIDNAILYRQAQEAIAVREEVMSILSHDLKSPLQAICSATALLQEADTPRPRGRSLAAIRRAVDHMNRLIQGLLESARLEEGRMPLSPEPVEVAPLLAEAVAMFQDAAARQSVRIEQAIEPDLTAIRCDRERLLQVLTNLLSNALGVLPDGGEIHLKAERRGSYARIEVADNGPGVAEEALPHLFDRFWQARHAGNKGTGLGLAIARGIVEAHGGEINVRSAVGHGASFFFTVPLAAFAAGD